MKPIKFVWGLILVIAGGLFLAQNFNLININSLQTWELIFAGFSLLFFVTYFVGGLRNWGWLFPAFAFTGLALTMYLVDNHLAGSLIGSVFLWCAALPFLVPFAISPRKNWWALIPAWILGIVGVVVLLANHVRGEFIAIAILMAFALPFLLVFLIDRKHWWALIPAYVFLFSATTVLLATVARWDIIAALIVGLIALPFFIIYIISRKNWWALIPGGILASVAISLVFVGIDASASLRSALISGVMFLGFAMTFGVLWLQRAEHFTAWARYPAIGCLIIALLAFSSMIQFVWPIVLIAIGLWMITGFRGLRSI